MRLLLDESVPVRLKEHLPAHSVQSVIDMGWSGVKNGELLKLAAAHFDVFITVDKNLVYQQNLATLPVAVIVLDAPSTKLDSLLPLLPDLEAILVNMAPRTYARVRA